MSENGHRVQDIVHFHLINSTSRCV